MRDAHGGIGGVHMLPPGASGTIGIRLEVLAADIHLNGLVDLGRDEDAGKRSMPPLRLVEGGNAHESMNSDFASQHPERVFAVYGERRRLDAGFFPSLIVVYHRFESLAFSPTQVHAHEHLGPILRLGSARARVYGDDR